MLTSLRHEKTALLLHEAERRQGGSTFLHIESFQNLVKYLVRLRRDGILDDDDFSTLVKMASAVFVEAEVADKVEKFLQNKAPVDYLLGFRK